MNIVARWTIVGVAGVALTASLAGPVLAGETDAVEYHKGDWGCIQEQTGDPWFCEFKVKAKNKLDYAARFVGKVRVVFRNPEGGGKVVWHSTTTTPSIDPGEWRNLKTWAEDVPPELYVARWRVKYVVPADDF